MQRARLGCLTGTGIIATLITAFAIAGYSLASGGQMFSPGALNASSGQLIGDVTSHADIAGRCSACHVAPWETQTMDDRCVVCHTDISAKLTDVQTSHGRMYAIDPKARCRDCHHEHQGAMAPLTEIADWKYPHQLSGYALDAHQFKAENETFQCEDCHSTDVTTFDVKTCATCHSQKDGAFTTRHVTAFGESCLKCHDGKDSLGKSFTHANFSFTLTGKHAAVFCEDCHLNARGLTDLQATSQACATCHAKDDPHGGSLGPDCGSCHSPDGWKPARFDHNRSVFKLLPAHVNMACANCHINNVFKGTPMDCFSCHKQKDPHGGTLGQDCGSCHKATTWKDITFDHSKVAFTLSGKHNSVACASCHKDNLFKNTPTNCAACHNDVHSGQMGNDCAGCHNPSDWKDVRFDHGKTGFALTGNHTGVACTACHINGIYKGTSSSCYSCHAAKDPHGGQFGTDCGTCHDPSGWKNVNFDHGSTGFPLKGAHTNVQCTACHANGVFRGTPKDCIACHAARDAHNGQFGTVCSTCHNPSSWNNVNFDHGTTGFPLAGSHASAACSACHVNNVYQGTPKNCYACHAAKDNHNGQFGTDCGACHKPTQWSDVTFNHGNTAFPLSGKHINVQCAACHSNGVYKGTPTNCYACHASKDNHNGQFGTNCGACHNPSGWANVTFDHNNTAFPLIGHHAQLECKACHGNGVYQGTPTQCIGCHRDEHNGQNGTDCNICHTPKDWGAIIKP